MDERIRLLVDLPVEAKHGMTKGRVLDARPSDTYNFGVVWWVTGDTGEQVGVLGREAEMVDET